jgi:hypothetical protein
MLTTTRKGHIYFAISSSDTEAVDLRSIVYLHGQKLDCLLSMSMNRDDNPEDDADFRRQLQNEEAWRTLHGYRTTSGWPCFDETSHACIPKHIGWGYNPNFYVICCFPFWRSVWWPSLTAARDPPEPQSSEPWDMVAE